MKKQIFLLVAFAFFANWAVAQDYGIRGFSSLVNIVSDKPGYDSKAMLGYGGGVYGKFEINNKIFFQPEINYNVKGVIYPGSINLLGTSYKTDVVSSLQYLEVPLHLEHDLTKHLGIEFGPYFGY
jgi:Outer membrane protein beta-barrel domain